MVSLFYRAFKLALGPNQPPVQKVAGAHSVSVDLLAEVKNAWSSTSTPRMRLWRGV